MPERDLFKEAVEKWAVNSDALKELMAEIAHDTFADEITEDGAEKHITSVIVNEINKIDSELRRSIKQVVMDVLKKERGQ